MKFPLFSDNPLRTREDVQRLLQDLTAPILPHFSEGRAEVHLGENRAGYGDPAGWLEGFARPLWGLVPLAAGGGAFDHWSLWQQGIANGTDPQHPEYWGLAGDFDQRSVEQAAFGFGLALAPDQLWKPLPVAVQTRLVTWLQRINEVKLVQSNWLFFRVLVNLGLKRCGQPWSRERVDSDLTAIDQFYLKNGWYTDGAVGAPWRDGHFGDYYIPMAFHLYGLIYARLNSDEDPVRAARFVERARLFARDYQYYFAADGSALPFGRSLTYRTTQGAFWGGLAFAAVEALPWAVIKGLYLRHLRWWMRQPAFSETGLLTIGYAYPNLLMAESYNSSQSPYWAFKAFLPLSLPGTHPFWRAEEAPLPRRRAIQTIPGAKLILVTSPGTRDVTAINPGQPVLDWPRSAPQKYSKAAYSTRFGFSVAAGPATLVEGGLDNGFSLSDDGRFYRVREQCFDAEVKDGVAYSRWQPWPDVELRTWLIATETGHLRLHHLITKRKLDAAEAGFAIGYMRKDTLRAKPDGQIGPEAISPVGASTLHNLLGARQPEIIDLGPNSNVLSSLSTMPVLRSSHEPGEHRLACWVSGSGDPADTFALGKTFSVKIEPTGFHLLRESESWWRQDASPCGQSSPARLQTLA